jgi:deazaflavin-dependent oxidoreductase (nitroreductase family)
MSTDQNVTARQPGRLETAAQRFIMKTHISLYRITGGAIGSNMSGRSFLLLTTVGRKSGKERITPLQYVPDGKRFLLIASNGGALKHPQWLLNLHGKPQAVVQVGAKTINVTATEASGEERSQLWSLITSRYPNFAGYQQRTTREIPVVILTPNV